MATGRKVKIPVVGTVNKTVFIDPNATRGATLGMDLFTPDGIVGTPNTVREWLGLTPLPPGNVEDDDGDGTQHHRLLQGLTLGDDHPQYTQWIQDEVITGEWTFENTLTFNFAGAASPYDWQATNDEIHQTIPLRVTNDDGILIENPDFGGAGIHLTTFAGADPLNDGIGNQLAFWEVGDETSPFTPYSYGFRIRHTGDIDAEGNLDFYRHQNDTTGVLFMRFTRDSSQVQFTDGTSGAPVITHIGDLDTGLYFPALNQVGLTSGGTFTVILNASGNLVSTARWHGPDGTNSAPSISFSGDTNTGMYTAVANTVSFTTDGTERLSVGNTDTSGGGATRGIRSTLSFRGPAGSATVPAFTFTGDDNTGYYSVGADQLGISVGGTLRATWTTAALVLTVPVSAANGAAATPSYAFTNDLDTGMYRAGTDILAFATAGTLRFAIDAGGGFGLGATPSYGSAGQVLTSGGPGASPTWSSAGSGVVATIVAGDGIVVDDTDPSNPEVAVDLTFAFTWTGQHRFEGATPQITLEGADTRADFHETGAAADEGIWAIRTNNGQIFWEARSDDQTTARTVLSGNRSGVAVTQVILGNTTDLPDVLLRCTELQINGDEGTTGQILSSNGAGNAPTWEDPPAGSTGITVNVYTADDTWSKPANTGWVEIICVGQGGGGASGRKSGVGITRTGGGGGGGGGYSRAVVRASDLGATVAVECNGGGTGGTAITADTTNGNNGTAGEPSAFGTVVRAEGGAGGSGGAGNTVAGGAGGRGITCDGGNGGTGGTTTTGTVGADAKYAGGGGGGGHGVSSANNVGGGLNVGGGVILTNPALAGGTSTAGAAGGVGQTTGDAPVPGSGGGGGAGNGTGSSNGFNGGAGGAYGGGGGGGGANTNGGANPSGAGGNGGSGVVIVISYPT